MPEESPRDRTAARAEFEALRDRYVRFALERNPVTSTYLGGDGWDPTLAEANGRLRDFEPAAIADEVAFYRAIGNDLRRVGRSALDGPLRVDAGLLDGHIAFHLHQLDELRTFERAIDTYLAEPFRGVDWQLQQMVPAPGSDAADPHPVVGTDTEWQRVVDRVAAIPAFLATARRNLATGFATGNAADPRMVERDGLVAVRADADYFRTSLLDAAAPNLRGGSRGGLLAALGDAVEAAVAAFAAFEAYLATIPSDRPDSYAIGDSEYEWRVHNNLRDPRSAAELWTYGGEEVASYQDRLYSVAAEIGTRHGLDLRFGTVAERGDAVRAVVAELGRDAPHDDDERLAWYVDAGRRAVAFGREHDLFDIPSEYRLDVFPTPPLLRGTFEAAYYPAAPLKRTGVGRFYLTPTGNDPAALAQNGRPSVATVAVHEGFPGHDWQYRILAERAAGISAIRWLTPGAVEDSSAMWADSMSMEGWGLYAEQLMGEPVEGSPYGFFSLEEQFYYLYWNLRRAMRVRADVGIHTGRLGYDEAIEWWAANQDFEPDVRRRAEAGDATARAVLEAAERNVYRYSKWPTQAITYNLGRRSIVGLRDRYLARQPHATARDFHEWYLGLGTVAAGYLGELL